MHNIQEVIIKNKNIIFTKRQLQKKFKHANDFDITGNYDIDNMNNFKNALKKHITDKKTVKIEGNYRGNQVTHYVNRITRLNVIIDFNGKFLSGWKLNQEQFKYVLLTGKL
ncbi:hypothetical protein GMMP15_190036 [Candidatus Magnetomoraceae bacterium gMMP-15]